MTNKVSFFSLFVVILVNSQQKKMTYFDKSWKETTKDNTAFYRPAPVVLNDSIEFIRDYFINGKLQYQGYSLKKENYKKVLVQNTGITKKGLTTVQNILKIVLKMSKI